MTAEIIELQIVTKLDIPVERVLNRALEADLAECVIVGFTQEGGLFFASNKADAGAVLYHLEMAKKRLLDICDA